jgi:hypothetical protein
MAQASVGSGWDLFVESDGWDLFVDAAGSANELSEDDDPDAAEEHPTTNLCSAGPRKRIPRVSCRRSMLLQ